MSAGRKTLRRIRLWQTIIFVSLFFTYIGIYFCRANLTIASVLLFDDDDQGSIIPSYTALGVLTSVGTFVYAGGKMLSGWGVQLVGHKWTVILGSSGAVIFSLSFGFGRQYELLIVLWSLNRFFQAFVWSANMQFVREWFFRKDHGSVTAALCLSFLAGDAIARVTLSALLDANFEYTSLFVFSSSILAIFVLIDVVLLRPYPKSVGLTIPEDPGDLVFAPKPTGIIIPPISPASIGSNSSTLRNVVSYDFNVNKNGDPSHSRSSDSSARQSVKQHLLGDRDAKSAMHATRVSPRHSKKILHTSSYNPPSSKLAYMSSGDSDTDVPTPDPSFVAVKQKTALRSVLSIPAFYVICVMNIGVTFIREAFRDWGPLIFKDISGVDDSTAGFWSSVYPIAGGVATLMCGFLSDYLPGRRRGGVILFCMVFAVVGCTVLTFETWDLTPERLEEGPGTVPLAYSVTMISLVGFGLYGPFTTMIWLSLDWCPKNDPTLHPNSVPMFVGLMDGVGYFAGATAGAAVGGLTDSLGWGATMLMMSCAAALTIIACVVFYFMEQSRVNKEIAEENRKKLGLSSSKLIHLPDEDDEADNGKVSRINARVTGGILPKNKYVRVTLGGSIDSLSATFAGGPDMDITQTTQSTQRSDVIDHRSANGSLSVATLADMITSPSTVEIENSRTSVQRLSGASIDSFSSHGEGEHGGTQAPLLSPRR